MTNETADPKAVVHYAMAKSAAEDLTGYVARGRKFKDRPAEELADLYVIAFQRWAAEPTDADALAVHNDLGAEYSIRGVEPPIERVKPELESMAQRAVQAVADMTPEQRQNMNDRLYEDFDDLAKRRN